MRRGWFMAVVFVVAATVSVGPQRSDTAAAARTWVDATDRAAVLALYRAEWGSGDLPAVGFTGDIGRCDAGTASSGMIQRSLARVNAYRSLVGVPPTVTESADFTNAAQAAAMLMDANNRLSHSPPSTWNCYSPLGFRGAQSSNLYLGRAGVPAIDGYIVDPGANNSATGHRWWIMRPTLAEIGVGSTERAHALYVVGSFGPGSTRDGDGYVTWPTNGYTPAPLLSPRWSVFNDDVDFSAGSVVVRDGKGALVRTEVEYRSGGRLVFRLVDRPPGEQSVTAGDDLSFDVTVSTPTTSYTYTVRLLGVLPSATPPPEGQAVGRNVRLDWRPPILPGVNDVESYRVERDDGLVVCITSSLSCTDVGVGRNTAHRYRTFASNQDGESPASGWSHPVATGPLVPGGGVLRVRVAEAVGGLTVLGQLTVDRTRGAGYVTAFGCDDGVPRDGAGGIARSDLNFDGGVQPVASNRLIVSADADGDVCFYTSADAALIVDVNGVAGEGVTSLPNQRTDTRR